ncbi:MAG: Ig-like domain-containing protein, partial [Treponema sp.]|nr:Ig-like domain-containing protein [Treponema sp.]
MDFEVRAVDRSGNVTVKRLRIPVDQNADLPVVSIDEPAPLQKGQTAVIANNGTLNLIGTAKDNKGVASIFYSIDSGTPVEIPCSGYFQLTITGIPDGSHTLDVWAKDTTGLVGPKVQIKNIVNPGSVPQPEFVQVRTGSGKTAAVQDFYTGMEINSESGSSLDLRVRSGAALASITYTLGSRAPVTVAVKASKGGEFIQNIPIPADIDFGQVLLNVSARDVNGNETPMEDYIYVTDLTSPRIIDNHVPPEANSDGTVALTGLGGQSFWPDRFPFPRASKAGIPISASVDPSVQVAKAVFTAAGRIVSGKVAKDGTITAVLPADLPADLIPVTLTVTPKAGDPLVTAGEFWLLRPQGATQQVNTAPNFTWLRPDTSIGGGRILLSNTDPLLGLYTGRPLANASITGSGAASFAVSLAGTDRDGLRQVTLSCSAAGNYGPLRLVLTDIDGKTYTSPDFTFSRAASNPSLDFVQDPAGKWVQNQVALKYTVKGDAKIRSIESSIDLGASWQTLADASVIARLTPGATSQLIESSLSIADLPDGAISLSVRVTDESNGQLVKSFFVNKDTQAPVARLVVPVADDRVNGTIMMGIAIEEAGQLASVVYNRPAVTSGLNTRPAITKTLYTYNPDDTEALPLYFMSLTMDQDMPLADNMRFIFSDLAGNSFTLDSWPFVIDQQMDIPKIEISLPLENEVITTDFTISGIAYDDDAVKQIYWRIDNNPDQILEVTNGYSIPISLSALTDNEHTVTVVAEDIYGVKSDPVVRKFRVSLEEPKARLESPGYDEIVKGNVKLSGVASDMNGIDRIQVSLDNGNSYNDATGTTAWTYNFNSVVLQDGTHVVFTKVWDKYGISALYSSLINIDNTPPEVTLDAPLDGITTTGIVNVTGRTTDNILMDNISIEVRSLDGNTVPPAIATRIVPPGSILMETLDLSPLRDGMYNVEVWAIDKAKNITRVSRNIQLAKNSNPNYVDILYPLDGEYVQGSFNLYGRTGGVQSVSSVTLYVDGAESGTADVTEAGYFRFNLDGSTLTDGIRRIDVRGNFGGDANNVVKSTDRFLNYNSSGAWVTIDSLAMGDFAFERPWLSGRAGFTVSDADQETLADKTATKEQKDAIKLKKLSSIELSFDNGKTFITAGKGRDRNSNWSYRLETDDMVEGMHYLIVKANMENGETGVTRT